MIRRFALRDRDDFKKALQGKKILWVDDNLLEYNSHTIDLFRFWGASVAQASNTDDAMALIEKLTYNLIISDMNRKGEVNAGPDFMKKLEKKGIKTPTIIMTGSIPSENTGADYVVDNDYEFLGRVKEIVAAQTA
jgi:DNA-binding NtrC family response regulator